MRKIETGRAGNQIYLTISNCFMRPRAHIKIWNMQEFWKTRKSFWRCSWDFLGPLRNQYGTTHFRLTIFSRASEHLSRFGKCGNFGKPKWRQRVSHTVRAPESTTDPIRNVENFRKIETVRDSRRIYQCRKPNLSHNQQLLHASARVHKNMKHARILPLVKNIVSQRLFVSCQFCWKEWRHLITRWYLFSYSLGSAIVHKVSFQKCSVALLRPSGTEGSHHGL